MIPDYIFEHHKANNLIPSSLYKQWVFFDTNCLSLLIKEFQQDNQVAVQRLVKNQTVLITPAVFLELSRTGNCLLDYLLPTLQGSFPCLCTNLSAFWYADIVNFLNVERKHFNALNLTHLDKESLGFWRSDPKKLLQVENERLHWQEQFVRIVIPDVGGDLDERELCIFICTVIFRLGKEWFNIEIPPADCTSSNFPSFFTLYYTYWFKFIKQGNTTPKKNDFEDLQNIMAAPYCKTFYLENSFGSLLRSEIQNRRPPSSIHLAKKLFKKGMIEKQLYNNLKKEPVHKKPQTPLLQETNISTYSEMKTQIS